MRKRWWIPLGALLLAAQVEADVQREWVFQGSTNIFTLSRTATFDQGGNILVTGGDFESNIISGWVLKLDRSGNLVWKTARGTLEAYKAALDPEGNLLVLSWNRAESESADLSQISPTGQVLQSLQYGETTSPF